MLVPSPRHGWPDPAIHRASVRPVESVRRLGEARGSVFAKSSTRERVREKQHAGACSRKAARRIDGRYGGGHDGTELRNGVVRFVPPKIGTPSARHSPPRKMLCPSAPHAFEIASPRAIRARRAHRRRKTAAIFRQIDTDSVLHARKCKAESPLENGFIFASDLHAFWSSANVAREQDSTHLPATLAKLRIRPAGRAESLR